MRHISQDSHEEWNLHAPKFILRPGSCTAPPFVLKSAHFDCIYPTLFRSSLTNRLKGGRKRAEEIPLITLLFAPSLHAC